MLLQVLFLFSTPIAATSGGVLVGAHYFGGWYNCSGYPAGMCDNHFAGFSPTGSPLGNFFAAYPERAPLLGTLTTNLATIVAEVHAADTALDFFSVLYYDGGANCGFNADPNLQHCLDSALAFMLNSTAVWANTSRLHFFITYSNDIDSGQNTFVGPAGAAAWQSLAQTFVDAMAHPRYMRVNGRPVFQVLIPAIFISQCGGNASLADALLDQLRAMAVKRGVGLPLVGGGWQVPSVPAGAPVTPRPHPAGYMEYTTTDIPCAPAGCDLARVADAASPGVCEAACNATGLCAAFVYYANASMCVLKATAGPGVPGPGDTYVRVLGNAHWDFTSTYNDAQPVCPGQVNWVCPQYQNSWWPNATAQGAQMFPYAECATYQSEARGNHTHDLVPYIPNVIAGFDPRPWEEHSASFAPPSQSEWAAALVQVRGVALDPANRFGFPDSSAPNGVRPAVTIYAWNEFGEGGILTPSAGLGWRLLQTVADVFGNNRSSAAL